MEKEKTLVGGRKEVMESELEYLKEKEEELKLMKQIEEREKEIKALEDEIAKLHPLKREKALEKIKHVLGEVRGTPEERKHRREELKVIGGKLRKIGEEVTEYIRETKEEKIKGVAAPTPMPSAAFAPAEEKSASEDFIVSIRKMRGY